MWTSGESVNDKRPRQAHFGVIRRQYGACKLCDGVCCLSCATGFKRFLCAASMPLRTVRQVWNRCGSVKPWRVIWNAGCTKSHVRRLRRLLPRRCGQPREMLHFAERCRYGKKGLYRQSEPGKDIKKSCYYRDVHLLWGECHFIFHDVFAGVRLGEQRKAQRKHVWVRVCFIFFMWHILSVCCVCWHAAPDTARSCPMGSFDRNHDRSGLKCIMCGCTVT